jgi:hypothetical protein
VFYAMLGLAGFEPLGEIAFEEVVLEIFGPDGGVLDAGLGERAVEVEHADEAGPLAGPVGDGEDGGAVGGEAVEDVVGVLPDGFGDDEGNLGIDFSEDFHPLFL